jgi:hypothetical protein
MKVSASPALPFPSLSNRCCKNGWFSQSGHCAGGVLLNVDVVDLTGVLLDKL